MTDALIPSVSVANGAQTASGLAPKPPWLVIVNPAAGSSRRRSAWPVVAEALRSAGVAFDAVTTREPQSGTAIAAMAVREGHRRLLVAGGDGSVHDVVNGVFNCIGLGTPSTPITLGAIPLGTGNDWARSLHMPRAPEQLAAVVAAGRTVAHDVGRIDFAAHHCWFINVAGAGFDAHVIERLPSVTPSRVSYLAGALRSLRAYRAPHFAIEMSLAAAGSALLVAPAERLAGRFMLAFVANGRYCGHRMDVAPGAVRDDGVLEVLAVDAVGLATALSKLIKLYRGTLQGDPVVHHARGAWVRIDCTPAAPVEADGQLVGTTPAVFTVRQRALRVLVP